ncbi:MAG TPA: GNAT family N-acetyltransferase [Gemmatales bacterium]|nr:GNAT family N-acetyltransferase [Gemmatales bacterium]
MTLETKPNNSDMNVIVQGLLTFNGLYTNNERPRYLVVSLRDHDQQLVGGLVGATYLGWLQVQALWIQDELRGNDYGSRLLQVAEDEAVQRGCLNACLETLSFQALPFYQKRGYAIYCQLPDFPPGHTKYFLKKSMSAQLAQT